MKRHIRITWLSLALAMTAIAVVRTALSAADANAATKAGGATKSAAAAKADAKASAAEAQAKEVELFAGMKSGDLDVKIIARNDREARVLIANKTGQPVNVKLPEAFAAVPALAQFGGGGGGQGGGGMGGGGGGGGQQSSGGGMGGGGGGMGGGGGGGMFSIPPDETGKIEVATVCLDHGLKIPSSSKPYKIVPADKHVKPEVVELLKAFGRGELDPGATQAAAWHLNSNMSWNDLATKLTGTERNINRSAYFSQEQIRTGMAYAQEAHTRAQAAAEEKANAEATEEKATEEVESTDAKSTVDYTAE
jgi:hypothetical protein